MDESKLARIADIVRSMNEAGMTLNEIRSQLQGMGLTEDEIEQVLSAAKAQPSSAEIHEEIKKVREKIETGEHLKPVVEVVEEAGAEAREAREKVEQVAKAVEETKQAVTQEIKEPVQKIVEEQKELHREIKTIAGLGEEVQTLRDMLIDINANIKALNQIMQKILETNRKLLQQKK